MTNRKEKNLICTDNILINKLLIDIELVWLRFLKGKKNNLF